MARKSETEELATKPGGLFSRKSPQHSFAMEMPNRTASVTSSALRKLGDEDGTIRKKRRRRVTQDRTWQQRAFDFAEEVGELGALLALQSNTVSLCDWPVRQWSDEQNDWIANDPEIDDDDDSDDDYNDKPSNVMRAFVGPQGGIEELTRRAAYNLFCAGEVHLLGTLDDEQNLMWEFLSVEELYADADGGLWRRANGLSSDGKQVSDDSYTARCWRSSARFSELADSEVKRVLPILQEILVLTQVVDAISKSKIPANIMFIPDSLTVMGGDADEDEDEDVETGERDLVDELFDHLTVPLEDPSSAARVVPLVITGTPNEQGKSGIEIIELARNLDALSLQDLRQEALGRLAQGLDAPPEYISGKTSANHWTAANVDSEFIVKHIQPIGRLLAEFITIAYLRPMLETFEDMSAEDAQKYMVEFDPSPVIARADEARSARDLADWLSDEAILTANGFSKADMASDDTIRQRRLWQLVSTKPEVFGKLISHLDGFEEVSLEEVGNVGTPLNDAPTDEEVAAGDQAKAGGGDQVTPVKDVEIVDAESGTETPQQPAGVAMALLVERLATASDAALGRALERAGNRLVSLGKKDPLFQDRVRHKHPSQIMALTTVDQLAEFGTRKEQLVRNAWDDLGTQARTWISAFMVEQGWGHREADEIAAFASHALCERMEEMTLSNLLCEFRRGSNGLRVPSDMVFSVLQDAIPFEAAPLVKG